MVTQSPVPMFSDQLDKLLTTQLDLLYRRFLYNKSSCVVNSSSY